METNKVTTEKASKEAVQVETSAPATATAAVAVAPVQSIAKIKVTAIGYGEHAGVKYAPGDEVTFDNAADFRYHEKAGTVKVA